MARRSSKKRGTVVKAKGMTFKCRIKRVKKQGTRMFCARVKKASKARKSRRRSRR